MQGRRSGRHAARRSLVQCGTKPQVSRSRCRAPAWFLSAVDNHRRLARRSRTGRRWAARRSCGTAGRSPRVAGNWRSVRTSTRDQCSIGLEGPPLTDNRRRRGGSIGRRLFVLIGCLFGFRRHRDWGRSLFLDPSGESSHGALQLGIPGTQRGDVAFKLVDAPSEWRRSAGACWLGRSLWCRFRGRSPYRLCRATRRFRGRAPAGGSALAASRGGS